jgi:hypothetical protein
LTLAALASAVILGLLLFDSLLTIQLGSTIADGTQFPAGIPLRLVSILSNFHVCPLSSVANNTAAALTPSTPE